ncbi:hypothetical protein PtrCC142_008591, partial [Pyrenophora tritici-repentis]
MVYITSDLFGPSTTNDWQHNTAPSYWHTMAHEQHTTGLGKRRRQVTDDGQPANMSRPHHRSSPSCDATFRMHHPNTPPFDSNSSLSYSSFPSKSCEYTTDRRPVKQLKRVSPKATVVKSTSHLMDVD